MPRPNDVPINRRRALLAGAGAAIGAAAIPALSGEATASRENAAAFPLGPFEKSPHNPILRPDPAHEWESAYLYNPCAILVEDQVALLYRAQNAAKTSCIGLAFSDDGVTFRRHPEPVLTPTEPWEIPGGCEDPRVVRINGTYYLTYTAYDGRRALLCMATSTDLVRWAKHPPLFPNLPDPGHGPEPWNKSGAIAPVPIQGWYWMYFGESNIFWARSRNLLDWETPGNDDPVATPVFPWEKSLIEPGPPPVLTDDGRLLLIYNGRADGSGGYQKGQYSGGQLLIDPQNPTKALARLERPFIFPTADDEQNGQVNHVVFSEGLVRFRDRWFLYYGMADSVLGVATAPA
ncbi:glycoside hydrolase family 130 protein [Saccharopolyspora sp. ASAGF58]|uniref:glycoside hydrolase family 130 protein n=1 Tax=Saccharopolyspora sp. ASAGF58 TaxID=2719023 RepID=UPI001B314AC7|nr:glycoside hydrolase family 130 protein [Saccharopolyspora sp. ASAGF58]